MAGLLSGLGDLGLGGLESADIFGTDESSKNIKERPEAKVYEAPELVEEDFIYDKEFECPVCGRKLSAKIMKANRAKLISTDADLRPKYEGIDSGKYDVLLCGRCGYAALTRYFANILPAQAKLIKENISTKVKLNTYKDSTYGYEQALERYKLALANAMVKKAKVSEKAYICLKTAWVIRGQMEELIEKQGESEKTKELAEIENEYLKNAYMGFRDARRKETFPIAGMDTSTLDYLLAQLAFRFEEYDLALRLAGTLLTSGCNERIKNKVRDLKDQILEAKKQ